MMLLSYLLLFLLSFFLPSLGAAETGISNNCPTSSRCGNIEIPYPFGIGSPPDCYFEPSFHIICDTSSGTPKPYLTINNTNYEVLEFQISTSQVRVRNPRPLGGSYYYVPPERDTDRSSPAPSPEAEEEEEIGDWRASRTLPIEINLSHTLYTLSMTNSITFIGCDDFLRIRGIKSKVLAGCASICINKQADGNCSADDSTSGSGNGCCQYPIPRGTASLSLNFTDMHAHTREEPDEGRLFPWSYAFIGEKATASFTYKVNALNDMVAFQTDYQEDINRPLVLDWRMGNQNCSQAMMNPSSYACKGISSCTDFFGDGVEGYICHCKDGYEGNPYVSDGCSDINECADSTYECRPPSRCKNTLGGYECLCPIGYKKYDSRSCSPSAWITALIAIPVSAMGTILLLTMCLWLRKILQQRNKRRRNFKRNGGLLLQQQTNGWAFAKSNIFTLKELEKATDFFNENQIIGEGGRGAVYKGIFPNGRIVAIKKAKLVDLSQLEEFLNEMIVLSQINNRHVVKLLGCCLESDVPLLVYQFIPNGTLFDLIHDPLSVEFTVTWNMRLKMAVDIAGAIAYLHHTCDIPIYHRDIKSNNILLDEKYVAKVSDFGCSRLVPVDQTHLTTRVMGTFGYLDPEYFRSSQFTDKSDVYSFGVVLVELLTGKMAVSSTGSDEERSLATLFLNSMDGNNVEKILDDQVIQGGAMEEVMAVAEIAKKCLNSKGKLRPSMKTVATELEGIRKPQMGIVVKVVDHWEVMVPNNDYSWKSAPNFPPSPAISYPFMEDFHSV